MQVGWAAEAGRDLSPDCADQHPVAERQGHIQRGGEDRVHPGTSAGAVTVEDSVPADGQARVAATDPQLRLTFNAPMDPQAVGRIHLDGRDAPTLKTQLSDDGTQLALNVTTPLQPDHSYALVVPSGVASIFGEAFRSDRVIRFSTAPGRCPPNVYRESFAGDGYVADPTLEVDLRNTESPHSGEYAIKLHATTKDGMIYFFAGTSDHGDGRRPVDLSPYKRIEFWMRGTPERAWVKIGHPVFDKAFTQTHMDGVTQEYKRFTLDLPEPKSQISTLLVIGIATGETLYLDDIRFVGDSDGR